MTLGPERDDGSGGSHARKKKKKKHGDDAKDSKRQESGEFGRVQRKSSNCLATVDEGVDGDDNNSDGDAAAVVVVSWVSALGGAGWCCAERTSNTRKMDGPDRAAAEDRWSGINGGGGAEQAEAGSQSGG